MSSSTINTLRRLLLALLLVGFLGGGGYVLVRFYPYIFAKNVHGRILKVEKVSPETIIAGAATTDAQMFSYAVSIKDDKGEIHTASSEDRQWAVAQTGQCIEAKFFVYPPWDLQKAGTYFGARLVRLFDCSSSAATEAK